MKKNTKGAAKTRNGLGAFFVYMVIIAGIAALAFSAWMFKRTMERNKDDEVIIAQQNNTIVGQLSKVIVDNGIGSVGRKYKPDSEEQAEEIVEAATEATANTPANTPGSAASTTSTASDSLAMLDIQGISCVGILRIGDSMTFAIADLSSEASDCYLPYYISGNPANGDLQIRGVSSAAQLGAIKDVEPGEEVSFTDVTGITYKYETVGISKIEMSRVLDALTTPNNTAGVVVSSEGMRENTEIDMQLYFDEGDRYRVVMDCKAKRGE